jgi:hypothetical protein
MFLHSYNVTAHVNHVHKGKKFFEFYFIKLLIQIYFLGIGYKPVDEAKLTCSICGKKFPRQNRVRQHMAEVHNSYDNSNIVVEETDAWNQQGYQQAC